MARSVLMCVVILLGMCQAPAAALARPAATQLQCTVCGPARAAAPARTGVKAFLVLRAMIVYGRSSRAHYRQPGAIERESRPPWYVPPPAEEPRQ